MSGRPAQVLIATRNAGKAAEFRQMLGVGGDAARFADLGQRACDGFDVEETGRTFGENASLKAAAYARQYGAWALADDSGLSVDALDGAPGIFSARFAARAGAGTGDAANNALLLERLNSTPPPERGARFICALALADDAGRIVLTATGELRGAILSSPRGNNGFGYDPLFLIPLLGKTTAELAPADKHAISHRGHALRRLATLIGRVQLFS